MFSTLFIPVCLVGLATAFTPLGFEPSSTRDLVVAFGSVSAVNGVNVDKASTNEAPQVGTSAKLNGTYTLMMVDADIPPKEAGGPTSELLHWMQPGLVSATSQSTIAGMQVFALENPKNVSALASYLPPNPPNKAPTSHRYIQLLLDTTGLDSTNNLTTLMKEAASRGNFDAVGVLKANGLTVLMGNSFNVTNAEALAADGLNKSSNSTGAGSARASGEAKGIPGAAAGAATFTSGALSNATAALNSARPQLTATPIAAAPINSATLTLDVLISTGRAQATGQAQATGTGAVEMPSGGSNFTAKASKNGSGDTNFLLASLGVAVIATFVL
ncbi:phosphatidylethanolamine-binding protein pebp [Phlyctema vagabunda]|uniref:Phosphatidylethanolamine-binding protein pebp n=1 Tax=Phlyctema vagabunda TaxID=108571 RepID=A0ABR4PH78_9HELO